MSVEIQKPVIVCGMKLSKGMRVRLTAKARDFSVASFHVLTSVKGYRLNTSGTGTMSWVHRSRCFEGW